jgi:carbamoyl-phosphate synthase large subunit
MLSRHADRSESAVRVLFTNAGRRTYLVQFALNLARSGYPLEVHVSDCTQFSAAMHVSPEVYTHLLPPVRDDPGAYVDALLALTRQARIDVVFPLSDLDPQLLAQKRDAFRSGACTIIVAAEEVIERCYDKRLTFAFCRAVGLPTPDSWFDAAGYDGPFPVFQKYIFGSGSSGIRRVDSAQELLGFVAGRDMLQAFVAGEEFGLDILNSLDGVFVAVCVKRKLLMRAGETDKAQVIRDAPLEALGRQISAAFCHVGNLDCDVLRAPDGSLYCIDFNPRFGGGYPATHLAGFDYLKAVLDMVRGLPPTLPAVPRQVTVMKGLSLHWCDTP